MRTAFPVINKLVGAEFFDALSGVYVRQHPPTSPLLMFYGQQFPEFLESFEHVAHLPYLADVARLELARRTCYHAADATPIDPTALSDIPPENLMAARFELAPAMTLIASPYPIQSIWIKNEIDPDHPIEPMGENVLLYRPELDVLATGLPDVVYVFLTDLRQGKTLGDAYETGAERDETFDLSAALGLLLSAGLITKINQGE